MHLIMLRFDHTFTTAIHLKPKIMKRVILSFCFTIISLATYSQNQEDYTKIVDVIKTSINTNDSTLITTHFHKELQHQLADQKAKAFVSEDAPDIIDFDHTNGKIIATELIMNDTDNNVYYVQFENDVKILTVALSEEKEITALQLEDY